MSSNIYPNLNSAVKKLTNMSKKDITKAFGLGLGLTAEAQKNMVYVSDPKFKNRIQFSEEGLQAIYEVHAYDKSVEDQSSVPKGLVYVTWDGKDFKAEF